MIDYSKATDLPNVRQENCAVAPYQNWKSILWLKVALSKRTPLDLRDAAITILRIGGIRRFELLTLFDLDSGGSGSYASAKVKGKAAHRVSYGWSAPDRKRLASS